MTEHEFAFRPTRALIDLENLTYNFNSIKSFVGGDVMYMAVVKADAYGHGAEASALRLERDGTDWFGVALLEEGIQLRATGIRKPILCFGGVWPGQEMAMLNHDVTPVVFEIDHARRLSRSAGKLGRTASIHIKIDTGMGRVGIPVDDTAEFIEKFRTLPHLEVEGIMTHFASADDLEESDFTREQERLFHEAIDIFRSAGIRPNIVHMANSPGTIVFPESKANMVRIGGLLYGLGGDVLPAGVPSPDLKPVMSLVTEIAFVKRVPAGVTLGYGRAFETKRDSVIGTIPVGYDDGYRRSLSDKGLVIVNGSFAPVVGRVSMDWTMIDLTDAGPVKTGDRVLLIGRDGDVTVRAEDLAAAAGTISYEITCGISKRVTRVYS